jgi:hypothetical protein
MQMYTIISFEIYNLDKTCKMDFNARSINNIKSGFQTLANRAISPSKNKHFLYY